MVLELYQIDISYACRSVLSLIRELELEVKLIDINPLESETMKPEFLKINPQHCIPTLVDDGNPIWESRAILRYLVNKYAPDSDLYPKDPLKRAAVDRQLDFDACSLTPSFAEYFSPQLFKQQPADDEKLALFHDKLVILNTQLESSPYVAGDKKTIADLSIMSLLTTADALGINVRKYTNINKYLDKMKEEMPYYEDLVTKPCEQFKSIYESRKAA